MIDHSIRFIKAFWHETVKRIPYILIVLLLLIFGQLLQNTQTARHNSADTKKLLDKVATLSLDNKNLAEQNHELSQQNVNLNNQNSEHIDCLGKLFAQYTRTLSPIQDPDLEVCKIIQGAAQTTATGGQAVLPSSSQGQLAGSSTNTTPTAKKAQSTTSQSFVKRNIINPIKSIVNAL